jgi:hypothetical protein
MQLYCNDSKSEIKEYRMAIPVSNNNKQELPDNQERAREAAFQRCLTSANDSTAENAFNAFTAGRNGGIALGRGLAAVAVGAGAIGAWPVAIEAGIGSAAAFSAAGAGEAGRSITRSNSQERREACEAQY